MMSKYFKLLINIRMQLRVL